MGMEHRVIDDINVISPSSPSGWVRESRFGRWFLGTDIWRKYVLAEAVETLARLVRGRVGIGGCVLDIGCGQGTAAPLLDVHFKPSRIIGLDIDAELIENGLELALGWDLSADLTLTHGCATEIPFEDATVDMVFCHQLLHHMIAQRQALAEMHRVLRPGGLLLVAESCRIFIQSSLVRALFVHPEQTQHSANGYIDIVREAGFGLLDADIVTESPWWSLPDLGLRRRIIPGMFRLEAEPTEVLMVAERLP